MHEIEFRAKAINENRWIYGLYFKTPLTVENFESGFIAGKPRHCIHTESGVIWEIDINTLSQYIGKKDKNDKKIYTRDIVRLFEFDFDKAEAKYPKGHEWWNRSGNDYLEELDLYVEKNIDIVSLDRFRFWLKHESFGYEGEGLQNPKDYEVIGNEFDTPYLLGRINQY